MGGNMGSRLNNTHGPGQTESARRQLMDSDLGPIILAMAGNTAVRQSCRRLRNVFDAHNTALPSKMFPHRIDDVAHEDGWCGLISESERAGWSTETLLHVVCRTPRLTHLAIVSTRLVDAGVVLQAAPHSLTYLSVYGLQDWAPLARFTQLTDLHVTGHCEPGEKPYQADLTPLAACTKLQHLAVWGAPPALGTVEHGASAGLLEPLRGLAALTHLTLRNCGTSDLEPISGLTGLVELELDANCGRVTDADVQQLAGLSRLEVFHCWGAQVSDLGPLAGLKQLKSLGMGFWPVTSLDALTGLTALETLELAGCRNISDLKPLAALTCLSQLSLPPACSNEGLRSIAGLTALTRLELPNESSCSVLSDLTPLSSLTGLKHLDMTWCQAATDLRPLSALTALETVEIYPPRDPELLQPLARLPSLKFSQMMEYD